MRLIITGNSNIYENFRIIKGGRRFFTYTTLYKMGCQCCLEDMQTYGQEIDVKDVTWTIACDFDLRTNYGITDMLFRPSIKTSTESGEITMYFYRDGFSFENKEISCWYSLRKKLELSGLLHKPD